METTHASVNSHFEGAMMVGLQPVVLFHISDHHTRMLVNGNSNAVYGILLGVQTSTAFTIVLAYECNLLADNQFDIALVRDRFIQFTSVLDDVKIAGWYSTAMDTTMEDMNRHEHLMANLSEHYDPDHFYFLHYDSLSAMDRVGDHSFHVYVADQHLWISASAEMIVEGCERVVVDHIMNAAETSKGEQSDPMRRKLLPPQYATEILLSKLQVILQRDPNRFTEVERKKLKELVPLLNAEQLDHVTRKEKRARLMILRNLYLTQVCKLAYSTTA